MSDGVCSGNDTMNEPRSSGPLRIALRELAAWLESQRIPYVLIGGIAASLLGRPRITQDIDVLAVLEEDAWEEFLTSGTRHDFRPRITECLSFARRSRVFLLRHGATGIGSDVVLAGIPFEKDVVSRGRHTVLADLTVRLPRAEDLILMKLVAGRPRDIADVEGLIAAHDALDWDYVRRWAGEFAAALDASEIRESVERLRTKAGGSNA